LAQEKGQTCSAVQIDIQSMAMKLTYFDIRGLAETTRLLFVASGTAYEDKRLPISMTTPGDFSTVVREEFNALKEAGELDVALGKVPVLEVDGVKIGQSKAIERFVAKSTGMLGGSDLEAAQIDCLACHIMDIKDAYKEAKKGEDKEAVMKKWFGETLPEWLAKVDKSLPSATGPWLVGDKMSYADVSYYYFLLDPKGFFDDTAGAAAALATCPRLDAACKAVLNDSKVSDWVNTKRPAGSLPF